MYDFFRSLLFRLDAERAHHLSVSAARLAQTTALSPLESMYQYASAALGQTLWGMAFTNPVGLAAGFDKNAHLVPFWEALGFGFVEIGSVTAQPSKGNRRPRAFRLPDDRALINRMGLNNQGAERIARRIAQHAGKRGIRLGINIAKTHDPGILGDEAIEDFRFSFRHLARLADYIALNISCPNTAEGKTFEDPDALDHLLRVIFDERRDVGRKVPVLVKVSPPLTQKVVYDSQIEEVVSIALSHGVSGFIATNTTSDRYGLTTPPDVLDRIGRGGLSGAPLFERSTQLVRYLYRRVEDRVPIIGVGGVMSAEDAYRKLRAGASLVQVYTGLVYEGPGLVREIKEGLVRLMEANGFSSVRGLIGADA